MADSSPLLQIREPRLMGRHPELIRLFKEERNTDVEILFGTKDKKIRCHKFVFYLHSPVFETLISRRWTEPVEVGDCSIRTIDLPEDDPEIMKILIGFFYYDQELENLEQALDLIQMAHKYDCPHIVSVCSPYIKSNFTFETVFNVYQVSCLLDHHDLIATCNRFISANMTCLITSWPFLDMKLNSFIQFLEDENRKVGVDDLMMFRCIYNWTKAECHRNEQAKKADIIRPFLKYVSIPAISFENFTKEILAKNVLSHDATIEAYRSYSSASKTGVILDICDMIKANYSRRLSSTHTFKFLGRNVTLSEIRFTYDGTCSPEFSNKRIIVGIRIDGVESFYMNELENPLVVRFEPEQLIVDENFVDIFWSDKYEVPDFSEFSSEISSIQVHSSAGHECIFRLYNQNQPQRVPSECPLRFLCFMGQSSKTKQSIRRTMLTPSSFEC